MGPVLLLGSGTDYMVRANIWLPPTGMDPRQEQVLHSYELAHDHPFSFLTVGYFGPGYETTIWEYNPDTLTGQPGEQVELELLEHTDLPPGQPRHPHPAPPTGTLGLPQPANQPP
ncbi:hypothetical protein J7E99_20695 [Streptomyces sp. ISL-44]|uniref:hypothetical protein n=1 Tax=Streptomyces sp. ISL-44 TaxID=2819184 RepID=UPI001BEA8F6C|nr:hypothetical protein [Streptomyces sp. ISL-44]MBT2543060.1 hypothetical protein [Streptomyces sp. ISL-44]